MKTINCGIFPYEVLFFVGKQGLRELSVHFPNNTMSPLTRGRFLFSDEYLHCGIWVASMKDHGCIAHEVNHAVNLILPFVGIPLNDTTDEVYAYLTEHLINQMYTKDK